MKISVVVPVFNEKRVARALESVLAQQHNHELELIVVDAGSTDGTLEILETYRARLSVLVSEPDNGIYDGFNKGVQLSSGAAGDVVHILGADDQYNDALVLRDVMDAFAAGDIDACYGDLVYPNAAGKIVRYWKSGPYRRRRLYYGWMPPHQAFFVRKGVYERCGLFDMQYKISADYDFMLRLLFKYDIRMRYLDRVLVKMAPGGTSGKSALAILKANLEVARACRNNGMRGGFLVPVLKPGRKLFQLVNLPQSAVHSPKGPPSPPTNGIRGDE